MSPIKSWLGLLTNRILAIGVAASSAALLTYLQAQSGAGLKWALEPIARLLPWHHMNSTPDQWRTLSSEFTIAELFLITSDGKHAMYAKASSYVVGAEPLNAYFEGVTASDKVSSFSTEIGVITQTTIEHGFYVSRIDLGSLLEPGTRFRNVYRAELDGCFTRQEEHWTQEIAVPTKHLTLRIHFPYGRPPMLIRCKRVLGLAEQQTKTKATITRLTGLPAIVWEIEQPKVGDIYKLEWRW
jgi:hypothetical protein